MTMLKSILLSAVALGLVFVLPSCKKIQQDTFIKGLWRVNALYIDTMAQNQMPAHFSGFVSGNSCCTYKIDFQSGDVVFGYYLVGDSFASVVVGRWTIIKYNQMYLSIDSFADGIFDVEKSTTKKYKLTSPLNHVKYYDGANSGLDTTYARIEIERI